MADSRPADPPALPAPTPKPLSEKIRGWLDVNGYPLEMQCAGAFQDAGYMVEQGFYYREDNVLNDEPRELDVIAQYATHLKDGSETVTMTGTGYVECKSNAKLKRPWVVFTSQTKEVKPYLNGRYRLFSRLAQSVLGEVLDNANITNHPLMAIPSRMGYSLVSPPVRDKENGRDRESEDRERQDLAYNALLKLSHAGYTITGQMYDDPGIHLGFPILAVSTPLFECWLEKGGIKLEERKYIELLWQRPVGTMRYPFIIHVVHVDEMAAFAGRVQSFIGTLEREAKEVISTVSAASRARGRKTLSPK